MVTKTKTQHKDYAIEDHEVLTEAAPAVVGQL